MRRIAVSLPEPLFEEAEAVAKDIGVSRSRLLQAVVEDFLQRWRPGMFPEAIDHYAVKHDLELNEEGEAWPVGEVSRRVKSKKKAGRKTTVSFPADLLDRAEAAAKDLGVSRNDFVCIALSDFLVRHNSSEETRQLNRSYIKHPPEPDPFLDYVLLEGMRRMAQED